MADDFSWVYTGRSPDLGTIADLTKTPQPCRGVAVGVRREGRPKRVFDAVSGENLTADSGPEGLTVEVPDFEYPSVVVEF